ncbi:hypothetical protein JXA88_18570 [Candidatus Fermentibacteria bacterium]|nr:hypothetical protein [Candidatus Fermentibacteria bacterium]
MRGSSRYPTTVFTLMLLVALAGAARGEIPLMISYQGRVTDAGGVPVSDDTYTMSFRLFNASSGGTQVWESGDVSIPTEGGVFSVVLGASPQPAIILAFDANYWLQVTFDGVVQTPRQPMASVGYAYMASGLVPGTSVTGALPAAMISGANSMTTGNADGLWGSTPSSGGWALYGNATAASGTTRGVYGRSASSAGRGVVGYAAAGSGSTTGVWGETASSAGWGLHGLATATTGTTKGVYGLIASPYGYGVHGSATRTAGESYGLYGETNASLGAGVKGENHSTEGTATGGRFESVAVSGYGVHGKSPFAAGYFYNTGGGSWARVAYDTYKIYGSASVAFVQNHPHDSEKVIVYVAPEGDEVATYTRGSARLVDGEARVRLGETFKWVTNPDIGLTAHLTPRGEPVPLAVVSISPEELVVRGPSGGADIAFDYLVYGLRIGFEEQSIVQVKSQDAPIPSMESHRRLFAQYPDLRSYTAQARFEAMYHGLGLREPLDRSASDALRSAIGEAPWSAPSVPPRDADRRGTIKEQDRERMEGQATVH